MVQYESFVLDNGLRVVVSEDPTTPMAAVNLIYDVGSRDEDPERTGFAHLFEHLMFGGSKNISSYDEHVQKVGGENNAFTSPDLTNFYVYLPAMNIETAFWLESDRMAALNLDSQVLEVQRKVVVEEFKQRYLNQPYGDVWAELRKMCYTTHPYRWPTIGKDISHIEEATMADVEAFYHKFYVPNNAVLSVVGNVTVEQVRELAEKWFGDIPAGEPCVRNLPAEPEQTEAKSVTKKADVPFDAIFKAYHMPGKASERFVTIDLLGDILGQGKSSRLHERLVKELGIFNDIGAFVTGSFDPGLFVVSGKLKKGQDIKKAEEEILKVLEEIRNEAPPQEELQKVKNQAEASLVFSEMETMSVAMFLGYATLMGDTDLINREPELIRAVTPEGVRSTAEWLLAPERCSTMYYLSEK
ncbi:peptidase M16 [Fulvitalea axinellae]|uniref:Peptidase M16 n=1 Tax=Fulvitalea axinellae TaxID=1182444 RepID=A0AAU9CVB8_9BACT|nr:peptidase M16 [Fulvitalea axinellae]